VAAFDTSFHAAAGAPRARLAYDRFVLSLRRAVGSMAGVLGGVDAVVFTGGIGENSARVRADVAGAVLVVHAREDLMVLDEVVRLTVATSAPQ